MVTKISVEHRPVEYLPFESEDQRLEKHGIKVECGTTLIKSIGPDGGVLFAKPFGSAPSKVKPQ